METTTTAALATTWTRAEVPSSAYGLDTTHLLLPVMPGVKGTTVPFGGFVAAGALDVRQRDVVDAIPGPRSWSPPV